ncbi:hypothetical protein J3R83DRAFT_3778 [Lanmaoa asiatica]|nr:hypothetical protein J3R83DRAFT_3778 [Lanmaoa asiatica]
MTGGASLQLQQPSSDHVDNHLPSTDSLPLEIDYPNTISSYLHQISHSVDDDPFGEKRRPVTTTSLSDARQHLIETCVDYVFNSLPTHLLRIADMSIVTRNEIWDAERSQIEDILDKELGELRYEYSKVLAWHWTGFLERSWCEEYAKDRFKFAIFSHRWGDREPLFQEMTSRVHPRPIPSGPGYDKLRRLCEKAQTDFCCRYVWSDTCCINKESSSELEEAIRSMYRWYSLANVCIVHLGQSLTVDDFERDPWFTRGWTLQELLAPKMMRFYGKDWDPIYPQVHEHEHGDKDIEAITSAITRVTGIPELYLQHFYPSCELVAQIMAWSAKRKTTRIEDRAYSLLGLFNISIPIAYGEGHRAFYRLMVALANECHTPSFFAWAGRHSDFSNALPSSPACYSRLGPDSQVMVRSVDLGHPLYEVTKLGVMVKLLVFRVHRKFTLSGGFHVGTTWYFDENAPLEPFLIRAGTGAVLPPLVPIVKEDDHEYMLGIVNFACPEPDGHGELVRGRKYFGMLMMKAKWGWDKLSTDLVISLNCSRDTRGRVENVLLLHTVMSSMY